MHTCHSSIIARFLCLPFLGILVYMRRRIKKSFVTAIGFIGLIAGIILIPYPGPGWLVVFAALGLLSTEYAWAQRLLDYGKQRYEAWGKWVKRQSVYMQLSISLSTLAVVMVTIWLVNGYGVINHGLNLGQDWADSPLPLFQ